jgi:hypothetical protein
MSIETLKEGVLPNNFKFVGTCNYCQGRYKWLLTDAEYVYQLRQSSTITCPTDGCGKKVSGVPVEIIR